MGEQRNDDARTSPARDAQQGRSRESAHGNVDDTELVEEGLTASTVEEMQGKVVGPADTATATAATDRPGDAAEDQPHEEGR